MTAVTRGLGVVLILIGVIAYLATDTESLTALLPALLGLLIGILGIVAGSERAHRHAIHGALVLALLGLLGSLPQVFDIGEALTGDAERPGAAIAATLTVLACLVYLVLGVRSFIAARRGA